MSDTQWEEKNPEEEEQEGGIVIMGGVQILRIVYDSVDCDCVDKM